MILPLCSAQVRLCLDCCVVLASPEKEMDIAERVQQRATKVIKGLEHLAYEQRQRTGTGQPGGGS